MSSSVKPKLKNTLQVDTKRSKISSEVEHVKHIKHYAKIEHDSLFAAILTSFEYVGNDLRKKAK